MRKIIKDLRVCQHKALQPNRKLDITRAHLEMMQKMAKIINLFRTPFNWHLLLLVTDSAEA